MQSDNKWNCREDRTTVFLLQFLMREKFGHLSNAGLLTNFVLQVWQSDTTTFFIWDKRGTNVRQERKELHAIHSDYLFFSPFLSSTILSLSCI